jgi:drug/metabolite transporter (DMT)-like permease
MADDKQKEYQWTGTTLVVLAAMTFAVVALIVKQDSLPLIVATEARFAVAWLMAVGFMLRYRNEQGLSWFGQEKIRWLLFLRAFLLYSYVTLWWASLPMAPLGDCIAIMYCDPIITVLWALVILGEKPLSVFPLQLLFAATGMLLIVKPPFLLHLLKMPADSSDKANYTFVFIAMFASSLMYVVTHKTKTASWIEVEHVTSFLAVFVFNPAVYIIQQAVNHEALTNFLVSAKDIDAAHVGLIVLASLGSFAGVAMQTRGYQLAEPGKASMFSYAEVPFAYFLQCMFTGISLSTSSMVGAFLVIMSCLIGAYGQFYGSQPSTENLQDVEQAATESTPLSRSLMGRRRSWAHIAAETETLSASSSTKEKMSPTSSKMKDEGNDNSEPPSHL